MMMFLASILIIGIALAGMAVGVMAGRPAIKGSCGGLNRIGIDQACGCSKKDKEICKLKNNQQKQ